MEIMGLIYNHIDFLYGKASNSIKHVLNQLSENSNLKLTLALPLNTESPTIVSQDDIEDGYIEEDIEDVEDVEPNKGYTKENLNTSSTKEQIPHPPLQEKIINSAEVSLRNIMSTINNNSEYLANTFYLTLYIIAYLRGDSEKEISDCFFKHEELKDAPIEKYLRQALVCQKTIHEFEKVLINTKSKFIISQFNSIPSDILENINKPWLNKWYKIFGNNKWLSKLFGYKSKVTFFENVEDIKNITKDGIDVTLQNINEPWLSKWYKIFGKNECFSNLFGYKDEEKIFDEIYSDLFQLVPSTKNKKLSYEDLKYTKVAIQGIKIKPLISKLQQQKTISKNQIEYLQILNEDIRELIQNKRDTPTSKYEKYALSELLNVHDNNNYQETTDNNYHDSTELIGE